MNSRVLKAGVAAFGMAVLSQSISASGFDVRIVNNGSDFVNVRDDGVDKTKYSKSDSKTIPVKFEFRGGCKANHRVKKFELFLGGQNYNIPVSGDTRHISGNNGSSWNVHNNTFSIAANNSALIHACNSRVSISAASGQSLESVLGSDFSVANIDSGFSFAYRYACKRVGTVFEEPLSPGESTGQLSLDAVCKATGYQEVVLVENVQLAIDELMTLGGSCKVKLKGSFNTSKSNELVRFRYEHIDEDFNKRLSEVHQVTTNATGYVNFWHEYDVPDGPGKDRGKVRIVGVSHEFQSRQKNYSVDCSKAGPSTVQVATPSSVNFSVTPVESSKKAFGSQICPTQVALKGTLVAGSDLSGQAVFVGEHSLDIYGQPFSINKGQTKNFTHTRSIDWSVPSSTTLTLGGGGSAQALMKQDLTMGFNIVGDNSQTIILSVPRKAYPLSCSWPTVNPGVQMQNGGFNTLPNHTGGGAPTDIQVTPSITPNPKTKKAKDQ
jgi:hypothetical protein